jgi:TatD DNase family protein
MTLVDSHCHLEGFARAGTLDAVLANAAAVGVETLVAIGTEPPDWTLYRELAQTHTAHTAHTAHTTAVRIVHTVGLHPCEVGAGWEGAVAQLPAFFAQTPRPVALGEVGLDYFHLPKDAAEIERVKAWQHAAFRAQLALAREHHAPVVVHARKAFGDCVRLIDESGVDWQRVVFHCFSEGADEVRTLNQRGGRASFTGVLTYPNAANIREACVAQGIEHCMVETDAPYLAPQAVRGQRCEPAFVRHTAEFAADLLGLRIEDFATQTTRNAREFYGF